MKLAEPAAGKASASVVKHGLMSGITQTHFRPGAQPVSTVRPQGVGTPQAALAQNTAFPPVETLLYQLGTQTRIGLNGLVQFNEPLIQQIAAYREQAVPPLHQFLRTTTSIPVLLEGLYTADRLAEQRVKNVEWLYSAVSHWNSHPDPLVQIYLAGFYRKINIPTTFGPMLATLVNRAVTQYPMQASPTYNVTEEVGGTILEQIAVRTANETVQRLMPYLQPYLQRNP